MCTHWKGLQIVDVTDIENLNTPIVSMIGLGSVTLDVCYFNFLKNNYLVLTVDNDIEVININDIYNLIHIPELKLSFEGGISSV